jgi:glycosyltransferase involved in cell wall biosynthesis
MKPQISMILSTHNNETTIKEAVSSILMQTFRNFEFIIVNDASTDKTLQILKKIKDRRIKIISNKKRQGLTKSLNFALKVIKTNIIARMDADDIAHPKRLKTQFDYLQKNPKIALCGSWVELIDGNDQKIKVKKFPTSSVEIKSKILKFNPFIHSSIMFKKSIVKRIGAYNNNFRFAQDYEFLLRVASKFLTSNIPRPLLKYRLPSLKSISVKNLKNQEKFALKARLLALTKYNYPKWQALFLIKPMISYLIPAKIKLSIYKFFWNKR